MIISFTLNGNPIEWDIDPGKPLLETLRNHGIVSVRNGCDGEGVCGLCAVILNGRQVNSCQVLTGQIAGADLITVDFYRTNETIRIIQKALIDSACVQCGYCTPAVTLAIFNLLQRNQNPDKQAINDALSGTLCRCTGYQQFYNAVQLTIKRLQDPAYHESLYPEFKPELRHVGKNRAKVDALMMATGQRLYVEDFVDPDAYHVVLLESPHAHAFIKKIDTSQALAMPGVVTILTHENCPQHTYTTAGQGYPEPSPYDQLMFSRKVRYVGDRVAAVLARTREQAEAAAAAIVVEYEVLPPVLSIRDAQKPGAPIVHHGTVSYADGTKPEGISTEGDPREEPIVYQFTLHGDPHRNLAASACDGIGDIDKGFSEADVVIERTYIGNRVQSTPLEPHVVYAKPEKGRLIIHASTQVPWHVRRIVARVIGLPEHKVRIIKERVGGGFGAKQDIVVEDIAGYLAWTTGLPVFFRYTRKQEFRSSRTRHGMEITMKLGAKKDGTLTAVYMKLDADTGAYGQHCLTVPMNAVSKSLPLIICDNMRFEVNSWYTNLPPAGAYQGYGAPKGSFAVQTALAELAEILGINQLDLIEKNRVHSGARIEILRSLGEGRPGAPVTLGECGLGEMISRGRKAFAWDAPPPPATTLGWRRGRGAVIIQQGSGLPGLDAANAEVRLLSDGSLLLLSGGADLGTGLDTVTAKLVAETLAVDLEHISVVSGDTDITPFDKGAYASSGTYFSGNAALKAAEDLKNKCLAAASILLQEPVSQLKLVYPGTIQGKTGAITLAKLAHISVQGEGHAELVGFGSFKTDHAAFPYAAHFVDLEANPDTGEVRILRYHAYQDCGTPINPDLAMGQVYGAVLKAIGHSLYEELLFDTKGALINTNFLDYKIPTIYEVPEDFHVEFVPVDDEIGPFGGKSVSEISVNGAAPAIAIALHDALGIWCREWPFTPERILKQLGTIQTPHKAVL
ncbi:MAG TPA: molybdopterin-dependent oxidoreductase Mo/Fe-S-binding subunit [Spirochaetia bacterium]|nr:molybdopterin-dependent oxidoreductase Mo/Fe-S-binding subunit [Spirochaetales bacterium]HQK33737.1 molybdopterin-dependent oxidoreductase Mo/Fe-S-binding subunit [Spirochaetales bacterium]HRS64429.1 molybdopterin-dependent oxidoreductase Mo/Fe-S-binding subunit [Spirochaetia bacterium]